MARPPPRLTDSEMRRSGRSRAMPASARREGSSGGTRRGRHGRLVLAAEEGTEVGDGAHQGSREDDRRVLVDADLHQALQVAQLKSEGVGHHRVRRLAQSGRGGGLPLGGDDLGALLPLGLGLPGHRPLHALGELDVLELDQGDQHSPLCGRPVEDLADAVVDGVGLGERLVQGVLTDHVAQRRLRDLVDGRRDVLDDHDGLQRVDDVEVGDARDIDADVVLGDDPLRLDRHRDGAQRYAPEHVDEGNEEGQSGFADRVRAAEPEQNAPFVLLHDPDGQGQQDDSQGGDGDSDDQRSRHGEAPRSGRSGMPLFGPARGHPPGRRGRAGRRRGGRCHSTWSSPCVTGISCGAAWVAAGIDTVSTPSAYAAVTSSGLVPTGRVSTRSKLP